MVFALGSGAAAIALLLFAPSALTRRRWQVRFPRAALTAWFGAFLTGCASVLSAIIATLVAALTTSDSTEPAAGVAVSLAAWLSLGAVGAVVALVMVSAEPLTDSHQALVRNLAPVAISREERGAFTLVRFEEAEPVACAIPAHSPEILVSTGLAELLTGEQLRAVLAHEYAHLRQRHGWVVRVAEVNALCLPRFLRAGRGLKRATLLLVELAADDAAARQAGAANLANALCRMAEATGDESLVLRAERLTLRRWPSASRRRVPQSIRI